MISELTDSNNNLEPLFKILNKSGIKSVGLNYLFLRPIIYKNIYEVLGHTKALKKISQAFCDNVDMKLRASKSRAKAPNLHFRKRQYKSISLLAERYGIETYVCGCKNPDVTKELTCRDIWQKYFDKKTYQYQLFDNQRPENAIAQCTNQC